jgi:hypothetical protein
LASTSEFRNGLTIDIDGQLWTIVYFQHVKPGKGGAFVRTKLKNVRTGNVVERTYRAGEKVNDVRLEHRPVTYSYSDGELYLASFDDGRRPSLHLFRIDARVVFVRAAIVVLRARLHAERALEPRRGLRKATLGM